MISDITLPGSRDVMRELHSRIFKSKCNSFFVRVVNDDLANLDMFLVGSKNSVTFLLFYSSGQRTCRRLKVIYLHGNFDLPRDID
jgi:hypothetical protein